MGLSDNERFDKIIYAINGIESEADELHFDSWEKNKLKALIGTLWETLFVNSKNSTHWILGGSLDSSYLKDDVFSLAFKYHHHQNKPEDDPFDFDENDAQKDAFKSAEIVNNMIGKDTIINDPNKARVLSIHGWMEQYFYAVNRYDDEFSKSFENLSKVFANIKAELFKIMYSDNAYYRTWLLVNIIKKCINPYNDDDLINKWFVVNCIHHDMRLSEEHTISVLEGIYFPIQTVNHIDMSDEKRLMIILTLAGRRFHYGYKHKQVFEMIRGTKISKSKIVKQLKINTQQKAQYEKDNKEHVHHYCSLTDQPVY